MHFSVLSLMLVVAVTAEEITSIKELNVFDYHRRFGIPEAIRIKGSEVIKIVGGSVNDVSKTPYQAGIVIQIMSFLTSVCGASLISSTRLVTAAHCQFDGVFTAQLFTVVLGSNTLFSGGLRIVTTDVVLHPYWNPSTVSNDIAVIRVKRVTFTNSIYPIKLPSGKDISNDFTGFLALVSGYGLTADDGSISNNQPISSVVVPVISNAECSKAYGSLVRPSNICTSGAGGRGPCRGDSGGALAVADFQRTILVGVLSFGSGAGCSAGFPSAYARVTSFVNWIQSI